MLAYPGRQRQLEKLIERLGLPNTAPINWHLLHLALTHPTASPKENYEQLEFVGDSVVRLAASELLLELYPNQPVGEFAAVRSILVSDRYLASIAESYGLGRYLIMSDNTARDRAGAQSRLANCFEALLAALYLSTHNLDLVRPWLDPHLLENAENIRQDPARQNYKAALQEWTQRNYKLLPQYQVQETGSIGDEERFTAEVWFQDRKLGQGKGRSIKAAEQVAAQVAYRLVHFPTEAEETR
ncbi:MAG: ribonuclease III [Oscillatoriales cyanobacterium RM2_1_1]|nr:ribonuclease III [Oscillatoriales cyanobacterium SM2_3_0]NJO48060.1 ribonuclease III [Oscillatoriales cyanobacterium RM2_1_1]